MRMNFLDVLVSVVRYFRSLLPQPVAGDLLLLPSIREEAWSELVFWLRRWCRTLSKQVVKLRDVDCATICGHFVGSESPSTDMQIVSMFKLVYVILLYILILRIQMSSFLISNRLLTQQLFNPKLLRWLVSFSFSFHFIHQSQTDS